MTAVGDTLAAPGLPTVTVVGQRDGHWIAQEVVNYSSPFILTASEVAAYLAGDPET